MSSPTANGEAPLDLPGLNKLYGEETVKELLQMSVDEARDLIGQIYDGIQAQDNKVVGAAAHQLKGLSSTMTINKIFALSQELEKMVKQGEWSAASKNIEEIKLVFTDLETYVNGILQS